MPAYDIFEDFLAQLFRGAGGSAGLFGGRFGGALVKASATPAGEKGGVAQPSRAGVSLFAGYDHMPYAHSNYCKCKWCRREAKS